MPEERTLTPDEARALLMWYAEAGVDEAVGDVPINRIAPPAPEIRSDPAAPPAAPPVAANSSGGAGAGTAPEPVMLARSQAREATTLEELRNLLAGFDACPLRYTAKSLCFADGNPEAPIMFVGEAPGAEEDMQGKPFVGRAGQLLDRMLAAIGLDRTNAYIANVVYWRPPGNRTPTPQEVQICRPFIERQIELVDPKILVMLGGASAKELLGRTEGILKMRGRWFEYRIADKPISAMATLHPAYLLRQPAQKKQAWRDLLAIKKKLEEATSQHRIMGS